MTPMMLDILALHTSGKSHSEIAGELFVSYSTVSALVAKTKRVMGCRTLAGCALKAYRAGELVERDGMIARG